MVLLYNNSVIVDNSLLYSAGPVCYVLHLGTLGVPRIESTPRVCS